MSRKPPRLTVDEHFDLIALIFSCRGTCDRLRTSTVIRDIDNILIAGGKNGVATIIGNPCYPCVRKVVSKNVKTLRYIGTYNNALGFDHVRELCKQKSVNLEFIDVTEVLTTLQKAVNFLQGPGGPFRNIPKITLKYEEEK